MYSLHSQVTHQTCLHLSTCTVCVLYTPTDNQHICTYSGCVEPAIRTHLIGHLQCIGEEVVQQHCWSEVVRVVRAVGGGSPLIQHRELQLLSHHLKIHNPYMYWASCSLPTYTHMYCVYMYCASSSLPTYTHMYCVYMYCTSSSLHTYTHMYCVYMYCISSS